jgi:hypothetical protein
VPLPCQVPSRPCLTSGAPSLSSTAACARCTAIRGRTRPHPPQAHSQARRCVPAVLRQAQVSADRPPPSHQVATLIRSVAHQRCPSPGCRFGASAAAAVLPEQNPVGKFANSPHGANQRGRILVIGDGSRLGESRLTKGRAIAWGDRGLGRWARRGLTETSWDG